LLASTGRNNADWFYTLTPNSPVEREAKAATHRGDASTLNIWTTNGHGYLGFATFPSWVQAQSEARRDRARLQPVPRRRLRDKLQQDFYIYFRAGGDTSVG